jgi:hypothetical protein
MGENPQAGLARVDTSARAAERRRIFAGFR